MQRYLNQLLADVEMAARSAPEYISKRVIARFMDDDDELDLPTAPRNVRLCDLFGLNRYAFPPSEKLTKKQLTSLLTGIENLWRSWNIRWAAPPRLTARPRYNIMVEKMTAEKIPYDYEYGASIDFCAERDAGKCPFGDENLCHCREIESNAQAFVESWEEDRRERFLNDDEIFKESPVQALDRWLHGDQTFLEPWMIDEEKERFTQFMAEEEMMAWLYFYQPRHPEIFDEEDFLTPEDFEDFEWGNDYDEEVDLPF